MGGRPQRSWIKKTYTVSLVVEKAIALRAAEQGIDPGTVIDILIWNTFLKPDEPRLERGGFTNDELDRIFAEEALTNLDDENSIRALASFISSDWEADSLQSDEAHLRQVSKLVHRWRKTRSPWCEGSER